MGAILIVDGPRLARVFFAARLPGSGGWGAGLAWQGRESGGSAAIASRGESIPGRSHGGAVAHRCAAAAWGCGCLRAVLVNCARHFWNDFYGGVLMHRPN